MKRKPEESEPVEEKKAAEQECSEAELEQVNGGILTREKGSSPGFGSGASIDL
jgi:hypothetical protein